MATDVELLATENETEHLLLQLGGVKRVAHQLDLTTQAVHNWTVRGIPIARRLDIMRLIARANAHGANITWRPAEWDPHYKILYRKRCPRAA